jgi:hypothetical protein
LSGSCNTRAELLDAKRERERERVALWLAACLRVLFCCRPAYGHVYPLMPLALACREAGHEVVFGTGDEFRPWLQELGFRAERVGISIPEADRLALREEPGLQGLPQEERWRIGVVVFGDVLARRTLEDLRPLLADLAPDLLVYDELDIGAAAAANVLSVPAVAHSLGRQLPGLVRSAALERLAEVARRDGIVSVPVDLFAANPYLISALEVCRTPLRPSLPNGSRFDRSPQS